jgi:virginiamycin B lyase
MTTASDGSIWFTEQGANKIGRLNAQGTLTNEYAIPTPGSAPQQITASPDGYVWFTERYASKIGRVTRATGAIAEFTLPGAAASGEFATAITTTSAGKVWFASNEQPGTARIGTISSTGAITELARVATRTYISGIVGGPDGNLWVTQDSTYWGDSVAKVNTAGWGTFTNYKLPAGSNPQSITVGPDSNLWFTEANTNQIGRITTTGMLVQFSLSPGSAPQGIVAGPDGALWITEKGTNKIARMTTTGQVTTELNIPTSGSQPFGLTKGLDGTLWFTEESGNKIGKVVV